MLLGTSDNSNSILGSAPATPSKSRITSRPGAYARPTPGSPPSAGASSQPSTAPSSVYNGSHIGQFPNGANQQYTSIVRSQSPLAPRPPLPGQTQRPGSPIQWNQSNLSQQVTPSTAGFSQQQQAGSSAAGPFSPTSPNAWASSPEAGSGHAGSSAFQSNHNNRQFAHNPQSSTPGPVPVPQPVTSINGPSRSLHSPGVPRSPIAENPARPILSPRGSSINGQNQHPTQQQQAKLPPFIRIRVTGIDRAKKELGIKMDAQTNIPTYHRRQSPIFERTYNEFSLLHGALSANHPETILPALPLPQTSATNEEEEDRFLKGVFQKFMDRITRDRFLILDDELRSFIEADFGVSVHLRRMQTINKNRPILTRIHYSTHRSPKQRS